MVWQQGKQKSEYEAVAPLAYALKQLQGVNIITQF